MTNHFAIIYFGSLRGGFARRMDMLCDVLRAQYEVTRIHSLSALGRLLFSRQLWTGKTSVVLYSDLMWPLVGLLRCIRPGMRILYMVRGDQVTWARHAGRHLRARIAELFQKRLVKLGCEFVFASEDLRKVFDARLGPTIKAKTLPNTIGNLLPEIRPFDGRLAVVGDFASVKNIEHVLESLEGSQFNVELYGNSSLPERWRRPWLKAHGVVRDLKSHLESASLVVLASLSEGFPNVLLDALEAGCGVVVHDGFPFTRLPVSDNWRFSLQVGSDRPLPRVLKELQANQPDFKASNGALIKMVESDWSKRVFECLDSCEMQLETAA